MIAVKRSAWVLGLASVMLASSTALADIKLEGKWPDVPKDKVVSLDISHMPREEALNKLADVAGWSIAVHDVPSGDVGTIHVKNQPAQKVLEMILGDGDYVAKRDGDLVTITGDDDGDHEHGPGVHMQIDTSPQPPMPAAPPAPPAPPAPTTRGEDRTIAGGNLKIEESEVVHDVNVFGGNVDVYGTVTGDLQVMGGNVRVHKNAHVSGDASTFGGTLTVDDGATVDGDVSVVGGKLKRSSGCKLGGSVFTRGGDDEVNDDEHEGPPMPGASASHAIPPPPKVDAHLARVKKLQGLATSIGESITSAALLFVFGAVLLALTGKRMEMMRAETATRPMRTFALGVVGFFAAIVVVIALCVTVIGIPVAVVGILLAIFASYAGVAAVLTVVGQALLKHKTESSYIHLAVGCAIFMVASAIPVVGPIVTLIVAALGIGTVVATRVGGLVPRRKRPNEGPYRTPPVDAPVDA
jgi:hypothetical protein